MYDEVFIKYVAIVVMALTVVAMIALAVVVYRWV